MDRLHPPVEPLLSIKETAAVLGVGVPTLYDWMRQGTARPRVRLGRRVRGARVGTLGELIRATGPFTLDGRLDAKVFCSTTGGPLPVCAYQGKGDY